MNTIIIIPPTNKTNKRKYIRVKGIKEIVCGNKGRKKNENLLKKKKNNQKKILGVLVLAAECHI